MHRLRAPDGCPWDRAQTHQSLRRYVLEEAYEVAEILDEWDDSPELAEKLADELGDLLLQVYLQAEIADQEDLFHIGDVYQAVSEKLIRRHPHVFGELEVRDAAHVAHNWESIKREERAAGVKTSRMRACYGASPAARLLSIKPTSWERRLPGLDSTGRAPIGALEKVAEEAREVTAAAGDEERKAEFGDLLFALTTLARHLQIEPEDALRSANERFRRRFMALEERAQHEGRPLAAFSREEWLDWWNAAKSEAGQSS